MTAAAGGPVPASADPGPGPASPAVATSANCLRVPTDETSTRAWARACAVESLTPERGVAVLIDDDAQPAKQIAIFLLHSGEVMAVGNRDPRSGANVMARGLIGSRDGRPTVCSPMFKDTFDLATGRCLTDGSASAEPTQPGGARVSQAAGTAISPMDLECHAVAVVAGLVLVNTRSCASATA